MLFIAAQRLELVRNLTTWDGEPIAAGEPAYRVEFVMDRLFSVDKVTPVNVGGDLEEYLNRMKLIDNGTVAVVGFVFLYVWSLVCY